MIMNNYFFNWLILEARAEIKYENIGICFWDLLTFIKRNLPFGNCSKISMGLASLSLLSSDEVGGWKMIEIEFSSKGSPPDEVSLFLEFVLIFGNGTGWFLDFHFLIAINGMQISMMQTQIMQTIQVVLKRMVFYYQNCSDVLWEKIVIVIEKNFWNSRLKAENLQKFWDH